MSLAAVLFGGLTAASTAGSSWAVTESELVLFSPAEQLRRVDLGFEPVSIQSLARHGDRLYLVDMGNPANDRADLAVLVVPESDPSSMPIRLPVVFPDINALPPWRLFFDVEASFFKDGKLHLLTKHRGTEAEMGSSKLYCLDTAHTRFQNVLTYVEQRDELGGQVVGADLSPDGAWLAILTNEPSVLLIRQVPGQPATLYGQGRRMDPDLEAPVGLAWSGSGLRVLSADGTVRQLDLPEIDAVHTFDQLVALDGNGGSPAILRHSAWTPTIHGAQNRAKRSLYHPSKTPRKLKSPLIKSSPTDTPHRARIQPV